MTDSNVVELGVVTSLPIPVGRILDKAIAADLQSVIVIGWQQDGEPYFASSESDGPEALWLLELTKRRLFEIAGQ